MALMRGGGRHGVRAGKPVEAQQQPPSSVVEPPVVSGDAERDGSKQDRQVVDLLADQGVGPEVDPGIDQVAGHGNDLSNNQGADQGAGKGAGEDDAPEPSATDSQKAKARRKTSLRRLLAELAFVVLVVLVASFALKTFVIQTFWIPSHSMDITLEPNDRVMVTKLAPGLLSIHRGDIVVFHDPGGWAGQSGSPDEQKGRAASLVLGVAQALGLAPTSSEEFLIKRVIGLPGDTVSCEGSSAPVLVNGVALDETYLHPGVQPSSMAFDIEVPKDAIWVMGDNRDNSADSRAHQDQDLNGAVAIDQVVGVAQLRTWPLSRFGLLRNPGAVFAEVPNP